MNDEQPTVLVSIARFVVGMFSLFLGLLVVLSVLGMCIAPLFLPKIKKLLEKKYEKYEYKSSLIAEEFKWITISAWIGCIIAWGIVGVTLFARSNYYLNMVP